MRLVLLRKGGRRLGCKIHGAKISIILTPIVIVYLYTLCVFCHPLFVSGNFCWGKCTIPFSPLPGPGAGVEGGNGVQRDL